jgi:hypothetical protein
MRMLLGQATEILRAELGATAHLAQRERLLRLAGFVCLCGTAYGLVMGSFGGWSGTRIWQVLYSAAKVPLLLLGTFTLCLPSFFVLNTLAGLRSDFSRVVRALVATQASMTIVLCALAPFTTLWYLSSANYHAAILFNGLSFAVASLAAQLTLRRLYRPLVESSPKHRWLLRLWLGLYVFVGIQLGWILRPFVGRPDTAVQFLRDNLWGNAYVEVLHHLAGLFSR